MPKRQPLCVRLYFEPHLTELVRRIGYQSLPVPEAKARLAPLVEQYGKDRVNAAIKELLEIDRSQDPPRARLNDAARKAAWQLLGPEGATSSAAPAQQPG
jgi:hypothetical protein